MKRLLVIVLTGSALLATSGCLVMSGKSIEESGTRLTRATLDLIEPGTTSEAWVVATLGEPDGRTVVEGSPDTAVLRYTYTEHVSKGGTVFLIFAGGSETKRSTTTFFETVDGIVSRFWIERARQ